MVTPRKLRAFGPTEPLALQSLSHVRTRAGPLSGLLLRTAPRPAVPGCRVPDPRSVAMRYDHDTKPHNAHPDNATLAGGTPARRVGAQLARFGLHLAQMCAVMCVSLTL